MYGHFPLMKYPPKASQRLTLATANPVVMASIVVLLAVLWLLSNVVLLAFAAILVAILLRAIADTISRYSPLGSTAALIVTVLLIAALVAGTFALVGAQIWAQIRDLTTQIPELVASLGDYLGVADLDKSLAEKLRSFASRGDTFVGVAGFTLNFLDAVLTVALLVIAGIYLAARPNSYRRGFLLLWPSPSRAPIAEAMNASGKALRHWLLGQLAAMTIVGVLSAIGLTLLGVPSVLALAFIAALTDFVPIIGPIVGGIPAALLGFSVSPATSLWVVGLYLLIQQIEGNVVQPLVQSRAVDLPPVVTLFSLLAFGVLFGPLGVLLATPLAVLVMVCIKVLYIRNTLQEDVSLSGQD